MDDKGKVYYYDANYKAPENSDNSNGGGSGTNPVDPNQPGGGTTPPVQPEDPNGDNDGDGFYVADASDFEFYSDDRIIGSFTDPFGSGNVGILRYTGPTDIEVLELPSQVNGITITTWAYLFPDPDVMSNLKKVISNNKNIVNTQYLFYGLKVDSLDLTEFDVSGVEIMNDMFKDATIGTLNVDGWNTSKVTDMSSMFERATITNGFDLSDFNTSNVLYFYRTFADVKTDSLDLTNFRINSNASLAFMFTNAEINTLDLSSFKIAGTNVNSTRIFYDGKFETVYAGTEADADVLNAITYESPWGWGPHKPDGFTVAPKP